MILCESSLQQENKWNTEKSTGKTGTANLRQGKLQPQSKEKKHYPELCNGLNL